MNFIFFAESNALENSVARKIFLAILKQTLIFSDFMVSSKHPEKWYENCVLVARFTSTRQFFDTGKQRHPWWDIFYSNFAKFHVFCT